MTVNSLSILTDQWHLILFFGGAVFGGMFIITGLIKTVTGNCLPVTDYFLLSVPGWPIPILLLAISFHFPHPVFNVILTAGIFTYSILTFLPIKPLNKKSAQLFRTLLIFFVFFLFSAIINLVFISQMVFPAYFDSAEHYRIIKFLLDGYGIFPYKWPTSSYYHIGYHLILAAISKLLHADITEAMLVSGQLAMSTLTISLFFIIKRETESDIASFFTILLAGFGWYMPSYSINWGKYPAVFGLVCSIFVFNLIYLMSKKDTNNFTARKLIPFLLVGIGVSGILHTRSLVVCGFFMISTILANKVESFKKRAQQLISGSMMCLMLIGAIYLRTDITFTTLIAPYWQKNLPTLLLISFLSIFSIWKFPKLTLVVVIFTHLIFISLYIPLFGLFGYPNLFLMDRPYVQMLLHIPFSLIGGLGFAGLYKIVGSNLPLSLAIRLGGGSLLLFNAIFYKDYTPSDCCQLVGRDDIAAFSWIKENLPSNTHILIASQDFSLTSDASLLSITGTDAGIWVSPITERKNILFPSNADFTNKETLMSACKLHAEYIYIGSRQESFNDSGLITNTGWYKSVFILPEAKIYQIIGCL